MSLDQAVRDFESKFAEVRTRVEHSKDIPITWSGGLTGLTGDPPVLYADPDHAISSWKTWAMAAWNDGLSKDKMNPSLEWTQRPELIEYQITIADKLGRHRAVHNRWAVKSQFQVING